MKKALLFCSLESLSCLGPTVPTEQKPSPELVINGQRFAVVGWVIKYFMNRNCSDRNDLMFPFDFLFLFIGPCCYSWTCWWNTASVLMTLQCWLQISWINSLRLWRSEFFGFVVLQSSYQYVHNQVFFILMVWRIASWASGRVSSTKCFRVFSVTNSNGWQCSSNLSVPDPFAFTMYTSTLDSVCSVRLRGEKVLFYYFNSISPRLSFHFKASTLAYNSELILVVGNFVSRCSTPGHVN